MLKEKNIGLIGIGLFACLILQSITFLMFRIFEFVLIPTNINGFLSYGISKYLSLAIGLILFIVAINKIVRLDFDSLLVLKKTLIISFAAYFISELILFFQPFIFSFFETPQYFNALENYYTTREENGFFKEILIDTPTRLIKTIVIFLFTLSKIKPKSV